MLLNLQPLATRLLFIAAFCWLGLAGCGYQLQKPLSVDKSMQPVYIDGDLNLRLLLERELRALNIRSTEKISAARSIMSITIVENDTRNLTVSDDGRNAESMRRLVSQFSWRYNTGVSDTIDNVPNDRNIVESTLLETDATQINNPENYHAERAEAELVDQELRTEIINQILTRIRYAKPLH